MRRIFAGLLCLGVFGAAPSVAAPQISPCTQTGQAAAECDPVNTANPLPVTTGLLPNGAVALAGNGTGTTGAVVGTLTATSATTAFISGFSISAIGGTAAIGPITVAGLAGGSQVYQLLSSAAGVTLVVNFAAPIPASAVNTNITVTTTADGTATAVDVNAWGFRK